MPKEESEFNSTPDNAKDSLGTAPAVLAKRDLVKPGIWCPKSDIEDDAMCDSDNPKTITYKDILKATAAIRQEVPKTPLVKSKQCAKFGLEVNYKFESFSYSGSFHERGAWYSLKTLNENQKRAGVFTASTGNWARALAYVGSLQQIQVTVVLPIATSCDVVEKCQDLGAYVVMHGKNLAEAKRHAFVLINKRGCGTYLNGYDHPSVIAASGSIGVEILEQFPQTDAILVPIGGGGLISGIAAAVKHLKPDVLIYGIQPVKCCSFFKAIENGWPYQTEVGQSLAGSLAVPTAGYNAYHTACSLIDKMVLIDDDWISRAILHLVEEEKIIVEGAGATSLSALLAIPNVLPELREKTVVCVITGANVDNYTFSRCLERAKAIEGRIIKVTVTLKADDVNAQLRVLSIIANVGVNILNTYTDNGWLLDNDFETIYLTLICETRNLEHACTLKRVLNRIFPAMCEFLEEPFSPIPTCVCFPKKLI